ncbi:LacI family DNA-binding transcriptional regulator [Puniceicoccus vermicola]|uniref:LacI family DNA-binding transcriptional regulator n=1 Tax=Puniceicoccus vermicola TaxID=388746 RepID=A0A7X1AXF3_9BACT|nr:LacI family DNA-binding transcriptional regulator [Puniceicoccus vermicola]MBC2601795.1 LacI family DNA-binding transcriptional regulator [Puniceicoccus vermicola]
MSINQQKIAEALDVSVMTVSRALRDHPDLAEGTREMILRKAEEMGYRKHLKKRGKRVEVEEKPLRRMGILLFEDEIIGQRDLFKSGVVRSIFLSIQKECQRLGVETVVEVFTTGSSEVPMLVRNRSVSGIFLLGRYEKSIMERLEGIPAMAVSNFVGHLGLPRVVADNFHGMCEATEHLIGLGHERILFLGDQQGRAQIFEERSFGYLAAMQKHGLRSEVLFFDRRHEPMPLKEIEKVTGIVCSNDSLAYKVQAAMRAEGVSLPDECSMVSFDNIEAYHNEGAITSYEPDWGLMGRMAAELMNASPLSLLQNDVSVSVPGRLVVHGSTGAPRS